jgi:hypothetical protein
VKEIIYLVQGNCGEYSDYSEWVVCAYRREDLAQQHAVRAKEWRQKNVPLDRPTPEDLKNPYDNRYDYGLDHHTDWTAYGVEVRDALPEDRLAEIDKRIAAARQWGALLTALNEERQGILRAIAEEQR